MSEISKSLVALIMLTGPVVASAQNYTVTDLGTLGGAESFSTGINDSGQVTGLSQISGSSNAFDAFYYSNGNMQDLGTFGASGQPYAYLSSANAINASGQATGFAHSSSGTYDAFIYSNGRLQDLGVPSGAMGSEGEGINTSGQVVGVVQVGADNSYAFLYSNGNMQDLGTLGGPSSTANSINAGGQITGFADVSYGVAHAFLYSNGRMQDLGTFGGTTSQGLSINASGQITGLADLNSGAEHAFLYSEGVMKDLGTLAGLPDSVGNSINDKGQITGKSYNPNGGQGALKAFTYSNGQMIDLNSEIGSAAALYTLTSGQGINNNGQIVADGFVNATGQQVAFLLNPTSAVPLPASAWLMISGFVSLVWFVRKKRVF